MSGAEARKSASIPRMRAMLLLAMVVSALPVPAADDARFGTKAPGLVNLKGSVYFLNEGTRTLPASFEKMPVMGVVYTDRLDVPDRSFTRGFPGVTQRHTWFALVFEGQFTLDWAGLYAWRLVADDGAKLWVDGVEVIDLDGLHPPQSKAGSLDLQPGPHHIRVAYFQGPPTQVALQLFVAPPGQKERVFVMGDFAQQLITVLGRLGANATVEGIKVKLDPTKFFAEGQSELTEEAGAVLDLVAQALRSAPGAAVELRGISGSGAGQDARPGLAEARAAAVKQALSKRDTAGARLTDKGGGQDTRASSSVELLIVP